MQKISFRNDYSEGCHPNIIEALSKNNMRQQEAYGHDEYSLEASSIILEKCNSKNSQVYFVSGGTQANLIVTAAVLKPHESIIAAETGHIFNNEAGAIEATGHKISTAKSDDGKLYPSMIQEILDQHGRAPHQLCPKLVYISNSSELGTTYSKKELENLSSFCKKKNLFLFMDGARLGQALTAENNDLSLQEIARLTDVFYIGGTKNGAIIGEAIVVNKPALQETFPFIIKQRGGLLSKGRILGIQFHTLFTDDLFFKLAQQANQHAMKLKTAFKQKGCDFLVETFTNQLFPILSYEQIDNLSQSFEFYEWKKVSDDKAAIRVITSWATTDESIESFTKAISKL
jgi:threonine aldolase